MTIRSATAVRLPAIVWVMLGGLALRFKLIAFVVLPGEGHGADLRLFRYWQRWRGRRQRRSARESGS
jgi:hypothetical protein